MPEILTVPPSTSLCDQITEYSTSQVSLAEVLKMVQLLPRLQRLFIRDLKETGPVEASAEPIITDLKEIFIEQSTMGNSRFNHLFLSSGILCNYPWVAGVLLWPTRSSVQVQSQESGHHWPDMHF